MVSNCMHSAQYLELSWMHYYKFKHTKLTYSINLRTEVLPFLLDPLLTTMNICYGT